MERMFRLVRDKERFAKQADAMRAALIFERSFSDAFIRSVAGAAHPQRSVFKAGEDKARLDGRANAADAGRLKRREEARPLIEELDRAELFEERRVAISPGDKKVPKLFDARDEAVQLGALGALLCGGLDLFFKPPPLGLVADGFAEGVEDLSSGRAPLIHPGGEALAVEELSEACDRRELIDASEISFGEIRKERA